LKVIAVDRDNHAVTFQAQVKPEAKMSEGGKPIKLDQLKPGDEVRASFDPATGDVVKVQVTKVGSKERSAATVPDANTGATTTPSAPAAATPATPDSKSNPPPPNPGLAPSTPPPSQPTDQPK
jgi:hypothetical protein